MMERGWGELGEAEGEGERGGAEVAECGGESSGGAEADEEGWEGVEALVRGGSRLASVVANEGVAEMSILLLGMRRRDDGRVAFTFTAPPPAASALASDGTDEDVGSGGGVELMPGRLPARCGEDGIE